MSVYKNETTGYWQSTFHDDYDFCEHIWSDRRKEQDGRQEAREKSWAIRMKLQGKTLPMRDPGWSQLMLKN